MQGVTSSYNAFYKEDKFSKAHWTTHLGVFAAGFANGALAGGFEKGKGKIFDVLKIDSREFKYGTEALVRSAAVAVEFGATSFAKSNYKSLSFYEFDKKYVKSLPKLVGYLLTTFY